MSKMRLYWIRFKSLIYWGLDLASEFISKVVYWVGKNPKKYLAIELILWGITTALFIAILLKD